MFFENSKLLLSLIVFLPCISALTTIFCGRLIGKKGSMLITTLNMFLTFFFSILLFIDVCLFKTSYYWTLAKWSSSGIIINWGFQFDSLTCVMLVTVTCVSALVHLYSCDYMCQDPHIQRFMSYLSLFTFFMIMLVTADNFIQMFLGWEGVGLCSYLLVGFWFTRTQANKSAVKAVLINRIGDFSFLLGIMLLFFTFQSIDFSVVFSLVPFFINKSFIFLGLDCYILNLICLFLFIGAVGKSAQIGLHTWLPDAMEGPTPVSALIHAATMVTAGVFLIIRCSLLFEYAPRILIAITLIGAITAFFASTVGIAQNDIKKVIAYSTCSQLGYMIYCCGISNYMGSIFHLMNHAFFKALLFLSAGSIIHSFVNEQDMRKMGAAARLLPFTYSMMLIGSLALIGFPFLSGFYSKDIIMELAFGTYKIDGMFAYYLSTFAAFFSVFYSFRLLYMVFFCKSNAYKSVMLTVQESSIIMLIPLFILSLGSMFTGYFLKDMFIGFGTNFWENSIFILANNIQLAESEFIPLKIKLIPIVSTCLGILCGLFLNTNTSYFKTIYSFFSMKWYFDFIYNHYIFKPILRLCYNFFIKQVDKGFLEVFGPFNIANIIWALSNNIKTLQTGYLYHYLIAIIFNGFLLYLFIDFFYFFY